MRVKEEFNKYAKNYSKYSHIQNKIASILVENIDSFRVDNIVDIGSGDGMIYKKLIEKDIKFKNFYAIDFAPKMLKLHPKESRVKVICADFNKGKIFNLLKDKGIDLAISSSALQWAKDLKFTFKEISKVSNSGLFFLFTSNTFKSLHNLVGVKSPIFSEYEIVDAFINSYESLKIQKFSFKLEFRDTLDMLRYIKKSGVGGNLRLNYSDIKYIINNYPNDYLEFETILLKGKSRCQS
jgi:malonyl-CoA O-methyltransferase